MKTRFFTVVGLLILTTCAGSEQPSSPSASQEPPLQYRVVAREDVSYAGTPRMVYRIVFDVDQIPGEESIRQTSISIWNDGKTGWKEFTIFGYLPEMETRSLAYSVAEFAQEGLKEFRIQDTSLLGTKWYTEPDKQSTQAAQQNREQIVCDKFDPLVRTSGDKLELSLETDLPDFTNMMVSVSRSYKERGSDDNYPIDYFSQESTVGEWRKPHSIDISDNRWVRAYREQTDRLKRAGIWSGLAGVSDSIEISLTVPVNQPNPAFGKRNENLTGKKVRSSGNLRIVHVEQHLEQPLTTTTPS
ncbi:hypothetical protein MYX78_12680 [Acidobacteria bacterium AH-259-G07]|nr:hypothetical protein [Acidobacteria bacterium AH-259-G07]